MEISVFQTAVEEIKKAKSPDGEVLTKPFLDACKHLLPVVGNDCKYIDIFFFYIGVILQYWHVLFLFRVR